MARLEGKIALVTAAAQGIGRATAELFTREGARVIGVDINESQLKQLAVAETRKLDVTDAAAIQALAKDIGRIDVLFNCAGHVHSGTILDCEERDWSFNIDLNVTSM